MKTQTPHETYNKSQDQLILDVRTPSEFEETRIKGAFFHPLDMLHPDEVRTVAQGRPIAVVCKSGVRSKQAAEKLSAHGLDACVVTGGLDAWQDAGLPVLHGRQAIALERQVRIIAGTLVLTGTALGATKHRGWLALSGLGASGLIFAGVTDWCGMGKLLKRLPWNKAD